MKKKPAKPIPANATVKKFDGDAVKLELVFQPEDAKHLVDQLVNAIVKDGRRRR